MCLHCTGPVFESWQPQPVFCLLFPICIDPQLGLNWSTTIDININKDSDFTFTDPDCYRTTLLANDSNFKSEKSPPQTIDGQKISDCKVILNDVLSSSSTVKFHVPKSNQDKTHSVSSPSALERHYLDSLIKKKNILLPKMDDNDSWDKFDATVYNQLVGKSSVFERISLLEEVINKKGSLVFGFVPMKEKGLKGFNKRVQYSINLIQQKNELLNQIKISSDPEQLCQLQTLLNSVRTRLRTLRRGESNRKRGWKIKQARKSFLKNPYEAGKKILDPKCEVSLNCTKSIMDIHKSKILNDSHFGVPLEPLKGLSSDPILKFDFNSSNFSPEDFNTVLHSCRNGSSPGVNMIPYKVYKKCPRISSFLFKIFL